jgi:hypothetical protein
MKIERAKITDHRVLSELTKKPKAFWGFSPEQIGKWDKELTITPDYIKKIAYIK